MNLKFIIPVLLLLVVFTGRATRAQYLYYNIDERRGLPTNHVYNVRTDRLGYLWFCTPEGVVKYNGYEQRLINDLDVWDLYEDSKGRLWQYRISDELSYLKHDKYYGIPVSGISGNIKPSYIGEYPSGMVVQTAYVKNLVLEKQGAAKKYDLVNLTQNALLLPYTDSTFLLTHKQWIFELDLKHFVLSSIGALKIDLTNKSIMPCGQTLYVYTAEGRMYTRNLKTGQVDSFRLYTDPEEFIYTSKRSSNTWRIITNKHYYTLVDTIGVVDKVPCSRLVPGDVARQSLLSCILDDKDWGRVVTTSSSGAFLKFDAAGFRLLKHNLHQAVYLGKSGQGDGYWWDDINQQLIDVKKGSVGYHKALAARNLKKLIPYKPGLMLIYNNNTFFWLPEQTLHPRNWGFMDYPLYTPGLRYCHLQDTNTLYALSVQGFCKISFRNQVFSKKIIDSGSYQEMALDRPGQKLVLYDEKKLLLYNLKDSSIYKINNLPAVLPRLEKIFFDDFGNVFLRSAGDLLLYSRSSGKLVPLFPDIRLDDAAVALQDRYLVVAGKFGVAVCYIAGPDAVKVAVVYENTKSSYYNHIYGLHAGKEGILLNTDKGAMALPYPSLIESKAYAARPKRFYRMLATYSDTTVILHPADTLLIPQTATSLLLDVINPRGTGKLSFSFSFDDPLQQSPLHANELQLSGLERGRYYTLYITARDDVWRSEVMALKIFMVPYWYQTGTARILFIAGAMVLLVLLIGITYHTTRKAADKKNWEKNVLLEFNNLRLDFELKAINNQINPHFIFNTLNTSLYFIQKKKLEEAYDHISAFSDLLRSYLASAKNKFNRLSQELENLENYITLQQARFEDRFRYRIDVHADIRPKEVWIPPFLLQPIVENAINHGLLPKEEGIGNLELSFEKGIEDTVLICRIDDNGIGREKAKAYSSSSKARVHGNELIKELIDYYNKYEHTAISLMYIDKQQPLTGTTVIITVKKISN